jgi:hypothetical protein
MLTMQLDDIEALNYDDLSAVAKLSSSAAYKDIMKVGALHNMVASQLECCTGTGSLPGHGHT